MSQAYTAKFHNGGFKLNEAGKRGQGVVLTGTAFTVDLADAKTDKIFGILHVDAKANSHPRLFDPAQGGIGPVRLGATLTAGAYVIPDTDGDFIAATAGAASEEIVFGALVTGGDDGDVVLCHYSSHANQDQS